MSRLKWGGRKRECGSLFGLGCHGQPGRRGRGRWQGCRAAPSFGSHLSVCLYTDVPILGIMDEAVMGHAVDLVSPLTP